MSSKKLFSKLLAKSLLVTSCVSCFSCCSYASESNQNPNQDMQNDLKEIIVDLLKNKVVELNNNVNEFMKLMPGVNTIRKRILLYLIKQSLTFFDVLSAYGTSQSDENLEKFLPYIDVTKSQNYWLALGMTNEECMNKAIYEIIFNNNDIQKKYSDALNIAKNALNILLSKGVKVSEYKSLLYLN